MKDQDQYETVIGLEVHAQLLTNTKLFCSDSTNFGAEPNTQVSVISLAHPGTLPMINREVIPMAIRLGLALDCEIVKENYFARKNYFYPDLPKGYQVSQHTTPVCRNGSLRIHTGNSSRTIRINRIHMEEDAGKTIHQSYFSQVDYNRAGMPLLEIVTEPDLRSAEEAFAFVSTLRKLVRKLGVCDGNMEQGSFRCDVNLSVRKKGDPVLGTRVEIKNLNSIRFIRNCILFEEKRLAGIMESGQQVIQQTRGYNEKDGSTYAIRAKEDEEDYRYFPEPDLPPFFISDELIEKIKSGLPPSQDQIKNQLRQKFSLTEKEALQLSEEEELIPFFSEIAEKTGNIKAAFNWTLGTIKTYLVQNDLGIDALIVRPSSISTLVRFIDSARINHGTATQKIFTVLINDPDLDIENYISANGLEMQQSSDEIELLIQKAFDKYPEKITEYKKGKKGLMSLFVGEVMKLSNGKADAKLVTQKITEKLKA